MHRRQVLRGLGAGSLWLSGCNASPENHARTTLAPLEDSPNWLQRHDECPKPEQRAALRLSHPTEEVNRGAVLQYSDLNAESKRIARFAAAHVGGAVTCTNPTPFGTLLSRVETAGDAYQNDRGEPPADTYVGFPEWFRRIDYFRVHDGVFR